MRHWLLGGMTFLLLVAAFFCAELVLRLGPWKIEPTLRMEGEGFLEKDPERQGTFRCIHQRDNDLFWSGRPNTTWTGDVGRDIPVRMNSHGFRGPEFQMPKPVSTFRIACIGDSRTFGVGIPEDKTYPRQLERLLGERCQGDKAIEVLNLGIMGYTMFQGWISLRMRAPQIQPDVVALAFGFNDMMPAEYPDSVYYESGHGWLGTFKEFLRKSKSFVLFERLMLKVARRFSKRPEPHVLKDANEMIEELGCVQLGGEMLIECRRVDENEYRKFMSKAIEFCKSRGIVPLVISLPQVSLDPPYLQAPKYHQAAVSVCEDHGVTLVNPLPAFVEYVRSGAEEECLGRSRELLIDSCHPTSEGSLLIAQEVAKQLDARDVVPCKKGVE